MPCYCIKTGIEYAVKIVKSNVNVTQEVRMLNECQGHENILLLRELLKDEKYIYIVTELIVGSELHDYAGIPSDDAKYFFYQLADAVSFMHSKNIAHRDIKMNNILISNSHPKTVTIIDFGFAAPQCDDTVLTQTCFTLDYAAPEILETIPYTRKCDVWSLGVILYILLCGEAPFRPDNEDCSSAEHIKQITAKIMKGSFTESYSWSKVSSSAKDLIRGMLKVNPEDRLKIDDVINHEWLETFTKHDKIPSTSTCSSYYASKSTKAFMNSKIGELSDAYNNVSEKFYNSNRSFLIESSSNESVEPINNNNKEEEEDTGDFSLTLSDDEDKVTVLNESVGSDLDEEFYGFDESEVFYGFEDHENELSEPTPVIIIESTEIKAKTVKAVKPKVTKKNVKSVVESIPEVEVVPLRRTGRVRKQVIKIEPDDVLEWIEEKEVHFTETELKPKRIGRVGKRRNETDDRTWAKNSPKPKRRK